MALYEAGCVGGDVRWVRTKSGVPREKGGDSAICFRLSAKV